MSIRSNAEACVTLFGARLMSSSGETELDTQDRAQFLITQRARFNLWAGSNGVFADGNASLDFRIQEHQDIIDSIVGQLSILQRHLTRLARLACNRHTAAKVEAAIDTSNQSSASSLSSSDSSSTNTLSSDTCAADNISEQGDCGDDEPVSLVAIIRANDRLHRTAMAIRQAGATSHHLKAGREQFIDENGVNIVDVFRRWCLDLLHHRFKAADNRILDRLAQANGERRRNFLYRKQHEIKLRGRRAGSQTAGVSYDSTGHPVISSNVAPTSKMVGSRHPSTAQSVARASTTQLTQTTASQFNREAYHYEPSTQSTMFTMAPSTQRLVDSSVWPPAPRVPAGAAEFFCPYCCKIQPASERSGRRWKAHFLRDLSPFVCLVENCNDPYHLYPDQQSWLKHMESHNVEYTCRQHPKPRRFQSAAEFDRHVLQDHRQLPQAQMLH